MRRDRRIARAGNDSLVGGEQVVGEGVKVGNASDHRGPGNQVIAIGDERCHERDILRVSFHEGVPRVVIVGVGHRPVLGEVVNTDNLVPPGQELLHDITADEA